MTDVVNQIKQERRTFRFVKRKSLLFDQAAGYSVKGIEEKISRWKQVRQVIGETPQMSVRKVIGNSSNQASRTNVHRMLRFDLKLTPYTISVMQHLKDSDTESRLHFAHWMKENDQITDVIWFLDEAHFHLNAQVNKRNCRFWGSEKPDLYLEKPLHGEKVTAWAAMSSAEIIGPFFFFFFFFFFFWR